MRNNMFCFLLYSCAFESSRVSRLSHSDALLFTTAHKNLNVIGYPCLPRIDPLGKYLTELETRKQRTSPKNNQPHKLKERIKLKKKRLFKKLCSSLHALASSSLCGTKYFYVCVDVPPLPPGSFLLLPLLSSGRTSLLTGTATRLYSKLRASCAALYKCNPEPLAQRLAR